MKPPFPWARPWPVLMPKQKGVTWGFISPPSEWKGIRRRDKPIDPQSVEKYLREKFGPALEDVQRAMRGLAQTIEPKELNDKAFSLYERFRPHIPEGLRSWGAKGELNLKLIRDLAERTDK